MLVLLVGALSVVLAGCAGESRRATPPNLVGTAVPVGFSSSVRTASYDWREVRATAPALLEQLRRASPDGHLHLLALSGGGAGGAFGAGALVGLSRRGERPQFEIVTGVSTGALLAPFAFLGSAWDPELTDAFGGAHGAGLLRARTLDLLFRPGIYRGKELVDLVDRFVTPQLLAAIANEAASGRLLLVATTDLDKEEPVIWNLGAIAAEGSEAARQLFRDVLVASSSIPGLLPPVVMTVRNGDTVYDEMHVDGANALPFFVLPEALFLSDLPRDVLEGGEIYVLINGQVTTLPHTTPDRTIPIVARSIAAGMKHFSRSQLAVTAEFAERHGMQFRFATLPIDYPNVRPLDFSRENMGSMFQYGLTCAEGGLLWTSVHQAEQSIGRTLDDAALGPLAGSGQAPSCPLGEAPMAAQAHIYGPFP